MAAGLKMKDKKKNKDKEKKEVRKPTFEDLQFSAPAGKIIGGVRFKNLQGWR